MRIKEETRKSVLEAWTKSDISIPEEERKGIIADVFGCTPATVTAIIRKGSNGSKSAPASVVKEAKASVALDGQTQDAGPVKPGRHRHAWKPVSKGVYKCVVKGCKARKHDDHKGEVKQVVTVRKRRKARGAKSAAEAPSVPVAVAMEAGKWADDSVTDAELDLVFATQYGLVEMLPGGRVRATAHGKRVNALVVRFWPKAGEGDE